MGIKFKALGGLLVLVAASITVPAFADDKGTTNYETPNEVFDRAFFKIGFVVPQFLSRK
jgi:hypothetical protein